MDPIEEATREIRSMKIRGAGEIARHAVSALEKAATLSQASDLRTLYEDLDCSAHRLLESRPTAVSLPNGIRYLMHHARVLRDQNVSVDGFKDSLAQKADEFIRNSKDAVKRIGEIGARRILDGDTVMTHCNSRAVFEILRHAHKAGKRFDVYITETRPRFQGRLTAEWLAKEGIPSTLIVDSAMRYFMNDVDKVVVGADAVAANGALVNKIGTSLLALAAHEARTRFLVAAESFKFSPETVIGELIWIEERAGEEILPEKDRPPDLKVRNPAFDVTPPEYIDAIVTEKGIIPPQASFWILQEMFGAVSDEELSSYQTVQPFEEEEP